MTSPPAAISNPTCILNGHSVHVEEAKAPIAPLHYRIRPQALGVVVPNQAVR
jgi:hypothetical protein